MHQINTLKQEKKANNRNKGKVTVEIYFKNTPQNSLSSRIWKNSVLCIKVSLQSDSSSWYEWLSGTARTMLIIRKKCYTWGICRNVLPESKCSSWRRVKGTAMAKASHTSTSSLWSCVAKCLNRQPRTHLNSSNPSLPENKEKYFWSVLIFSIAIHKSEFTYSCKTPNANEHFKSTWTVFWPACLIRTVVSWALVSPGAQGTHPH